MPREINISRCTALIIVAALAILLGFWLWPTRVDYINLPPTASGPWVAFGDSLTAGFGASENNDYPEVLSKRLGVQIVNAGKTGDTTASALQRIDEVTALHPRVVLLCLGGNDALQREPRSRIFANLGAIIDRFHAEGSFVVLIGVRSVSLRDQHQKYFRELAPQKRVLYVPDILRGVAFKPVYMSDAIHPNDAGYQRIAERIEKTLEPFMDDLTR